LFTGCFTKNIPIQNKISENRDLDYDKLSENYVLIQKDCSNTNQRWMVYAIPISGFYSFTDEYVIDKLLKECRGDVVTNVQIKDWFFVSGYLNYYGVSAEGNIWRKK